MKKTILSILLLFLIFLITTKIANAQAVLLEDDFTHGSRKWQSVGRFHLWKYRNGGVEANLTGSFVITELVPTDEYWNPEWKNIEYELDYTALEGVDKNISFGYQDQSNWYEIHFHTEQGHYEVVRVKDGRSVWKKSGIYLINNNQTYRFKIRFNEGNIQIFVDNEEIVNADDWTFNNNHGKVSIKATTGTIRPTKVRIDNIVVRSIGNVSQDKKLDVPMMKQNDDRWKSEEYDHASKWSSKTTIQNWGCAMSSMAMVFDYHGISKMPDGQNINPSTLNSWLKSQPDGYIADGIVNWIAGTRLSRILNEKFGSTKLEFSRENGESIETAKQEVDENKPSILQIVGHFLVGTGYTGDGNDLFINDPAYNYQKFSEHNTKLLSTGKFTPSQTDLSYLLATMSEDSYLFFPQENGQSFMDKLRIYSEKIKDDDNSDEETKVNILTAEKPESGQYKLAIVKPKFGKFNFKLYSYDKDANPTIFSESGYAGSKPLHFQLDYDKNGESILNATVNWEEFKYDLTLMKQEGHLKSSYAYLRLMRLAEYAQKADPSKQLRYTKFISRYLRIYSRYMTAEGNAYLNQQLKALQSGL